METLSHAAGEKCPEHILPGRADATESDSLVIENSAY